jgi:hypothetical protein
MRGYGVEAVVIVPTPELYRDSEELGAIAAKAGLPTIGGFRESAQKGFLIGYGPNLWRTRPAGSKLCGANVQWRASGRVTVSRSHAFRLRDQHENGQSSRPHDPAVSPRGRRRGHRMSRVR